MPEPLAPSEINSKTDPSVAKQYDTETSKHEQIEDFFKIVDKLKVGLLVTQRPSVGPVARSMAVAKRDGVKFLFIANNHSTKFEDLKHSDVVGITFQDSSSQNWVSISGTATTSNHDSRIKDLYSPMISAWFGDLGDGKHTGKYDDPRMSLIEVIPNHVVYWKSTTSALGFAKEVTVGALTGQVANTGVLRELNSQDLKQAQ